MIDGVLAYCQGVGFIVMSLCRYVVMLLYRYIISLHRRDVACNVSTKQKADKFRYKYPIPSEMKGKLEYRSIDLYID